MTIEQPTTRPIDWNGHVPQSPVPAPHEPLPDDAFTVAA